MNKSELLKKLIPDNKIKKFADNFIKELPNNKEVAFELGGSLAKNTNLKGNSDIDIFARFATDGLLSERLYIILKKYKPIRVHGSRDYYQIKKNGLIIEIVPVLKISNHNEAKNVTDMSPLHVSWANKRLNKRLRDDIRLVKQFCKAGKIYGAESHIQGFSGHILDILVIYYDGFEKLLNASSKWKDKQVIDIEKHNSVNKLSSSKKVSPLIIIDPVQPDRNAAAGLGKEAFQKFKKRAKLFLETKDFDLFIERELKINKNPKSGCVIEITYKTNKGKADVIGSKIKQSLNFISKRIAEFNVKKYEFDFNKAYIELEKTSLSKNLALLGPPLSKTKNVKLFKKKYSKTKEEDGRIVALTKREYTDPLKKVKSLIEDEYVKKRIQEIKCKKY